MQIGLADENHRIFVLKYHNSTKVLIGKNFRYKK